MLKTNQNDFNYTKSEFGKQSESAYKENQTETMTVRSKYYQMSQLDDVAGTESNLMKLNTKRPGQQLEPLKDRNQGDDYTPTTTAEHPILSATQNHKKVIAAINHDNHKVP